MVDCYTNDVLVRICALVLELDDARIPHSVFGRTPNSLPDPVQKDCSRRQSNIQDLELLDGAELYATYNAFGDRIIDR